jgi:hypothetical protein
VGVRELRNAKKSPRVVFLGDLCAEVAPNQLEQAKRALKSEGVKIA